MNDTHGADVSPTEDRDEDLEALSAADPADAPEIAEEIAADLTRSLSGSDGEDPTDEGTAH